MQWGAYSSDLAPLIVLPDNEKRTDAGGCTLLLARPGEADNARKAEVDVLLYIGERRHFSLEAAVIFARADALFDEDQGRR